MIKGKKLIKRYVERSKSYLNKFTHLKLVKEYKKQKKLFEQYLKHKKIALSKGLFLMCSFQEFKGLTSYGKLNYYKFICQKRGHKIKRTLDWNSYNHNCIICHQEEHSDELLNLFIQIVENRGGTVTDRIAIKNKTQKVPCLCKYNHKFNISIEKLEIGQWCSKCNLRVGENKVRLIFEHIFQKEFPTQRPTWLKSPLSEKNLELDGYNEELKIAFEYQGPHHRTNENVIAKDKEKVKICKLKNISLIIIDEFKQNYTDEYIFQIILNKCKKLRLPIANMKFDQIDFGSAYMNEKSVRSQTYQIILQYGGTIIIDFENINVLMLIQCSNYRHKPFYKTPTNLIYHNAWCPECIKEEKQGFCEI